MKCVARYGLASLRLLFFVFLLSLPVNQSLALEYKAELAPTEDPILEEAAKAVGASKPPLPSFSRSSPPPSGKTSSLAPHASPALAPPQLQVHPVHGLHLVEGAGEPEDAVASAEDLAYNRAQYEPMIDNVVAVKRKEAEGQFDLFGGMGGGLPPGMGLPTHGGKKKDRKKNKRK